MRVGITGASGFIGQGLVKQLRSRHDLVLIGRDAARLRSLFSDVQTVSFDEALANAIGLDAIIHLSAANTDSGLPDQEIEKANINLAQKVAEIALKSGAGLIVHASTAMMRDSGYSRGKRQAERILSNVPHVKTTNLRLAAVYGETYRGRLAVLNKVPGIVRPVLFSVAAALVPTLHIDKARTALSDALQAPEAGTRYITDQQAGNWTYAIGKKAVDLAFALVVIVFLWWLLIVIYLAIRFTSAGPGILRQVRVGYRKAHFTCFKFRTMVVDAPVRPTHEVGASALAPLGKGLRRFKLDELPQAINVLAGQMSLVGPRPCLPTQDALIEARHERDVYSIVPGITGYAQANGIDMSDPERLAKADQEYLALRSIPLDLKIMLATLIGRAVGPEGANPAEQ